ncbi:histidine ammonia-lyase [Gemmatimonadetes bacterium T265]|nr:histidine ammonia-lyase [Gemmatimonadetes bacterium T265]
MPAQRSVAPARPRDRQSAGAAPVVVGEPITLDDVVRVARHRAPVALAPAALERVRASRAFVERIVADGRTAYGINTGFGRLAHVRIAAEDVRALQRHLVLSHAVGVGAPLPAEVVRAMLLLRAQSLAVGHSGIRPETLQLLLDCLDRGVHPVVPAQGSVGASGDLAPLAHVALTLIGEGEAELGGAVLPAADALARAGLAPAVLDAKEGLALINGTQAMTALGALAVADGLALATCADVAGAMSLEALQGTLAAFDPRVAELRPHPGAAAAAENVRRLGAGSGIHAAHADCPKVQDAYSLRCIPQVHGATRDALAHAAEVLEREANSVTDNPLLFPDDRGPDDRGPDGRAGRVLSAGNFHGQPVALAMDYAKLAVAELANISERRTAHLLDPAVSDGLPAFLTPRQGLNSGLMIVQYTAASLVSENKVLAHPASADSIPTSANQEDHVSMGTTSARHARQVVEHAQWVVAIELLCAAQALEFRRPLEPAPGTGAAYEAVRAVVPALDGDRALQADLRAVYALVADGAVVRAAEAAVGVLR